MVLGFAGCCVGFCRCFVVSFRTLRCRSVWVCKLRVADLGLVWRIYLLFMGYWCFGLVWVVGGFVGLVVSLWFSGVGLVVIWWFWLIALWHFGILAVFLWFPFWGGVGIIWVLVAAVF